MRGRQLKPPLSMTMPPTPVPWPPIPWWRGDDDVRAVREGLGEVGVLNVESTISGMFFACAIADTASRSTISSAGLGAVSQNRRVLSSMALAVLRVLGVHKQAGDAQGGECR